MKYQLSLTMIMGFCFSFCNYANGQANPGSLSNGFIPEVVPPSPTAASLGKFGEWPVSYYTGVPDISISVYEVKSRKLSLPISLSYHASGVKIEEISGWTGVGWTLNAGGVITKTIVGKADNEVNGFYTRLREGKYFKSSYTFTDINDFVFLRKVAEGDIDTEPDVYFFNFNGRSGKFFFDEQGNFRCIPANALKLTRNPLSDPNALNIWEIVDENGTTYTFGSSDGVSGGIEQSEVINTESPASANFEDNAWYLTRIVSNDKSDTIKLQYADKSEAYTMKSTQSIKEFHVKPGGYPANNQTWEEILHLKNVCYNGTPNSDPMNTRHITRGKGLLSSISWAQGEVRFFAGTARQDLSQGLLLDSILVTASETGKAIKKTVLQYSYKGDRYYLDSLSDFNRERTEKQLHSFYYYTGLPSRFSNSQDHWGFFNASANNNLLPNSSAMQTPTSANREPNESAAKSGTLRRIKYPTGGYTDFDYELHRYQAGSIPNAPTTEIGTGRAYASTYNYKVPIAYDSIVTFDVPFAQNGSNISIRYANYSRPNSKLEGWLPYIRLERLNGDGNYVLQQEWNAYDQFPGGNIPANTDGTFDFSIAPITVPLTAGTYRLTTDNTCSGFRCPDDNSTKAAIYADMYFQRYVQVPGTTQPDPVAGGLRIKTITNYDNQSPLPVTTRLFQYGTGNILTYPKYLHYYGQDVASYESKTGIGPCMTDFAIYKETTSSSQAILGVNQGSSVGYGTVREYSVNNEGIDNGYTKYEFLFAPDSTNDYYFDHSYWSSGDIQSLTTSIPVNDYSYKRGLLSQKTVYARAANGYKIVSSIKDEYAFNDGDTSRLYKRLKGLRVKKLRSVIYPCFTEINGEPIPTTEHFEYDYGYGFYNLVTSWVQKVSTEETTYDMLSGDSLTNLTRYYYDNNKHLSVSRTETSDSEGDVLTTYYTYPHELVNSGVTDPYSEMVARNMISSIVEEKVVKNDTRELTRKKINYESVSSSLIAPRRLETALNGNPLEEQAVIQQYDEAGNILQYKERSGITGSFIYDHANSLPIAKVSNAVSGNIAYSGFESTGNGNWQLAGLRTAGNAFTGNYYYNLSNGNITKSGLDQSLSYIISYWSNGGSAMANGSAGTVGRTAGGWTYYQHLLPSGNATVTISGTTGIDEMRLYPQNSRMSTFTYDPLVGMIAKGGENNEIALYEYDGFNRLVNIRDVDRNILKRTDYEYVNPVKENSISTFFNVEKRQDFTKNNCSAGTAAVVTYVVPAEKYFSYISQEDADNKAQADITANGQQYANTYGSCIFSNSAASGSFTRNNCESGAVPATVTYTVEAGRYRSAESQAIADSLALADVNNSGQDYANVNATCTYSNDAINGSFTTVCTNGARGSVMIYNVAAGKYTSSISKADANAKAQQDINDNGQNYANTNGTCLFYNVAMNQSFTRNNCSWGYTGAAIVYSVPADRYSSATSQAAANALAQNDINANGQNYANTNGSCIDDNSANVFISERLNAGVNPFTATISLPNGTVLFQQTFKELGAPALPFKVSVSNGTYTVKLEGMQQFKATVNGTEQTVTGSKTWTVSSRVIIEVYK